MHFTSQVLAIKKWKRVSSAIPHSLLEKYILCITTFEWRIFITGFVVVFTWKLTTELDIEIVHVFMKIKRSTIIIKKETKNKMCGTLGFLSSFIIIKIYWLHYILFIFVCWKSFEKAVQKLKLLCNFNFCEFVSIRKLYFKNTLKKFYIIAMICAANRFSKQ